MIARLLDGGPGVLATGGGAFMREETRQRIGDKGGLDLAQGRHRSHHAPGASDAPTVRCCRPPIRMPQSTRLLAEREPIYGKADITIASRDVPHDKIVDEVVAALHARLCGSETAANPVSAAQ